MMTNKKRAALKRNWRVYRLKGIRASLLAISTHADLTVRQQRKLKMLSDEVDKLVTQLKRRQK